MTWQHIRAVTRLLHSILGYFSAFSLGEMAQANAPVIFFFGRSVFRISTDTEALWSSSSLHTSACWIDSPEVRPWPLATLFSSSLVILPVDDVAYRILWPICSSVEQAMNEHFSLLPEALRFCGRNQIYVRTRLQFHEREWILCFVINECLYNRGV